MKATQDCVVPALRRMLDAQPLSPGKVRLAWLASVGQTIDRSTRVSLDDDGTLRVQARDKHWTREIARSRQLIRAEVNRLLHDAVKTIEVETDSTGDGVPVDRARAGRARPRR